MPKPHGGENQEPVAGMCNLPTKIYMLIRIDEHHGGLVAARFDPFQGALNSLIVGGLTSGGKLRQEFAIVENHRRLFQVKHLDEFLVERIEPAHDAEKP